MCLSENSQRFPGYPTILAYFCRWHTVFFSFPSGTERWQHGLLKNPPLSSQLGQPCLMTLEGPHIISHIFGTVDKFPYPHIPIDIQLNPYYTTIYNHSWRANTPWNPILCLCHSISIYLHGTRWFSHDSSNIAMSSVLLPAFFTTCPVFFHLVPDDFDQLSGLHIWILRPKDKPKTWTLCWTNGYIIHIYIYMIVRV